MQWYIRLQPHGQTRDRKVIVKHSHLSAQQSSQQFIIWNGGCLEFIVNWCKLKYSCLLTNSLSSHVLPHAAMMPFPIYLRDTGSGSTV